MKLSVVIPVYNMAPFLDRCLGSVLSQEVQNGLEVILVDDGSKDESGIICDKWARENCNVKVFHQVNQGVSVARKNGACKACGEWITFVDADDGLPVNAFKTLLNGTNDDVDIVVGQVTYKGSWKWPYRALNKTVSKSLFVKYLVFRKIHSGPVARLFRRKLFDEKTFDMPREIRCGEDFIMNLRLASNANIIRIIPDIVYEYISNPNSASNNNPFVSLDYCRMFEKNAWVSLDKESFVNRNFLKVVDWLVRRKNFLKQNVKRING